MSWVHAWFDHKASRTGTYRYAHRTCDLRPTRRRLYRHDYPNRVEWRWSDGTPASIQWTGDPR